jgi:hypothetical protein
MSTFVLFTEGKTSVPGTVPLQADLRPPAATLIVDRKNAADRPGGATAAFFVGRFFKPSCRRTD